MNTLELILSKQKEFQKKFGYHENMTLNERAALIETHAKFMMEETFEMLRELPYHKPWKDYSGMSDEQIEAAMKKVREEWIDALHFIINIAVFLDFDEEQIREEYLKKNGLNHERQQDPTLGYVKAS